MSNEHVTRDERSIAVENASYRISFIVLTYGVLIVGAVRGFAFGQACWDLLALVVVSSSAATLYQVRHRTLLRGTKAAMLTMLVAALVGIALIVLMGFLKR